MFDDEVDHLAEKFDGDRELALALVDEDHSLVRFYIPPEASWAEIRKLTGDIGQSLTDVVRAVSDANPSLKGVIDIVDFNATVSGQRIIEDGRLSSLIEILSRHRLGLDNVEPDLFGRAYEYLLRKFAEGQGQSAGETYAIAKMNMIIHDMEGEIAIGDTFRNPKFLVGS